MTVSNLPLMATFTGYITVIIGIAYLSTKLTSNIADYVLAGRRLSGAVTALAAGASDMSSWLLLALPGLVYVFGLNQVWLPLGLLLGAYLNWRIIAKRLRIYTELANDSLTIPEFLANRFQEKRLALRVVIALAIVIFFSFYAAANLRAGAILIQTIFTNIGFMQAIFIVAGVVVTYTILGGFLAVSWVDFFQGSLMFVSLLIVPITASNHLGGINIALESALQIDANKLNIFYGTSIIGATSLLAWGLGYFGQLHINTRFMAIRSVKELPTAWRICIGWMSFALLGAVATGFIGAAFYKNNPLQDPNTVFIVLARQLFNPWAAGILLSAVSAAIMNAVSAQMLMSASILVEDFYHGMFRKNASDRENLLASRIILLIVAGVAILIAATPSQSIFKAVSFAWSGLGATFGPVLIFSLYWRRMNLSAAVWGMAAGALTVIVWETLTNCNCAFFNHPDILPGFALVPGFIVSSVVIWLVANTTCEPSKEVTAQFDEFKTALAHSKHS